MVDFLVLAEPQTVTTQVALDAPNDALLQAHGVAVDAATPEPGVLVLGVRGGAFKGARALDAAGAVLADTSRAGYMVQAGRLEFRLELDPEARAQRLEITLSAGYRNP